MSTHRIILSGFGGQGMLSLGQIISYIAMKKNKHVTWIPSYGPEMRGGTANCSVIVSDHEIGSPIVSDKITHLVAMNAPSVDKFIDKMADGGMVVINNSLVPNTPINDNLEIYSVPATDESAKIGSIKIQNMYMLGVYMKLAGWFDLEDVIDIMKEKFTGKKAEFIPFNIKAVEAGVNAI